MGKGSLDETESLSRARMSLAGSDSSEEADPGSNSHRESILGLSLRGRLTSKTE